MTLVDNVKQLREQGLTDNLIMVELTGQGHGQDDVQAAISQADAGDLSEMAPPSGFPTNVPQPGGDTDRLQEIAENIIDQKWEELISEVRKIVSWKEQVEEEQAKIASDVQKLKDDFKILHQGVLGKLDSYDTRMQDVGTELKAVGKVFKDVVPQFVENVKELSAITKGVRPKS
jgi:hypothetical protein